MASLTTAAARRLVKSGAAAAAAARSNLSSSSSSSSSSSRYASSSSSSSGSSSSTSRQQQQLQQQQQIKAFSTSSRVESSSSASLESSGSSSSGRFTPKGRLIPTRPPTTAAAYALPSLSQRHDGAAGVLVEDLVVDGGAETSAGTGAAGDVASSVAADDSSATPASATSTTTTTPPQDLFADHPLWAFFHAPPAADGSGAAGTGTAASLSARERRARALPGLDAPSAGELERMEAEGALKAGGGEGLGSVEDLDAERLDGGRSWTAAELRLKSFKDLHALWYVLLRERNVLATQREERSRLGISYNGEGLTKKAFRCRKSMARIKYVLNERRLALIAAAESARPASSPRVKVHGSSPLGTADPLSLSGFETGATRVQWSRGTPQAESPANVATQADEQADVVPPVVEGESVAKQEVESRDEGFGGGDEAKEFVKQMDEQKKQ